MAIDFYECAAECGEFLNDCAGGNRCPQCKKEFCDECFPDPDINEPEDCKPCPLCSFTYIPDYLLLNYLMKKFNLRYDELREEYKTKNDYSKCN